MEVLEVKLMGNIRPF